MLHLHASDVITACPRAAPPQVPLLVDEDELGWIAAEDGDPDRAYGWYLHHGLRLAHWPVPVDGAVALHLLGGRAGEHDIEDEGFLTRLTRAELRQLIYDLQTIEAGAA